MENASKALLMAGGVLIAILVASLGVYFARSMAEQNARMYRELEQSEVTEFNEQFLKFNNQIRINETSGVFQADSINIQDVVTLINLAKNSNKKNGFTDDMSPANPLDTTSLYVTVNFEATSFVETEGGINILEENGTTYDRDSAEKFTENILTNILNREISKNILYSCEIITNQNTGYVNYIEINN